MDLKGERPSLRDVSKRRPAAALQVTANGKQRYPQTAAAIRLPRRDSNSAAMPAA